MTETVTAYILKEEWVFFLNSYDEGRTRNVSITTFPKFKKGKEYKVELRIIEEDDRL